MRMPARVLQKMVIYVVAGSGVLGASSANAVCTEPGSAYIGSICATAANFCPSGYLQANGQLLPIASYQTLFSLLGTIYGGNGVTTFALPDLRGRSVIGAGTGTGLSPVNLGSRRGLESATLNTNSLPQHTHTATFTPGGSPATVSIPVSGNTAGNVSAPTTEFSYLAASPAGNRGEADIWSNTMTEVATVKGATATGGGGSVTVNASGANQSFSIVPPQLALTYCISNSGLYPPRD